jgi:hypothetical protein
VKRPLITMFAVFAVVAGVYGIWRGVGAIVAHQERQIRQTVGPSIGMGADAVLVMCGPTWERSEVETEEGIYETYIYRFSEDRAAKGCYGTFRFRNGELESIAR